MVGIVIVSHSHRIAEGVAELAREMGGPDVRLETAGGLDMPDHPIGTDAVLVMAAIDRAWSGDGVLVLMDLGSAVLSAEMAIDLMPEDRRSGVLLCEAPIVRGRWPRPSRRNWARRSSASLRKPAAARREDRAPRRHRTRVVA
jgi:phosphocarrier protein FPr